MPRTLPLTALLLTIIGCHQASWFRVTGCVTLDGQPLCGATVEFAPEHGVPLLAETDADGHFEIKGNLGPPNSTASQYIVRVTTAGEMLDDHGESVVVAERVPARYNEQSELKVEVTAGRNRRNLQLATEQNVRLRRE